MLKCFVRVVLFCLVFSPVVVLAQEHRISGRVVDARSKEPVPFASIGLLKAGTGALSTEEGYFELTGSARSKQDSVIFMALGYQRHAVYVEYGMRQALNIELISRPINMISCPVGPPTLHKIVATPRTQNRIITGQPNTQYAFFIRNKRPKKRGNIRSVSFFIGEDRLPGKEFRLRIYKPEGKKNLPGASILTEHVFVQAPDSKAGAWYTIDLSSYKISVLPDGYFIGLEYGPSGGEPRRAGSVLAYPASGLVMRPSFDPTEPVVWSYTADKGWEAVHDRSNISFRAMIKTEVDLIR